MKFLKKMFIKWGWIKVKEEEVHEESELMKEYNRLHAKPAYEPKVEVKLAKPAAQVQESKPVEVKIAVKKVTPHVEPRAQATITRKQTPKQQTQHTTVVHNTTVYEDDSSLLDDVVTGIAVASIIDSVCDSVSVCDSFDSSSSSDWSGGGGGFSGGGSSDDW